MGRPCWIATESALDGFIPILRKGRQFARGKKLPDRTEEAIVGGLVWVLYQHIVIGDFDGIRAVRRQSLVVALGPYLGQGEAKRFTEIANSDP